MVGVNVGCGNHPQAGWVNVDVCSDVSPDVVAAGDRLPFASGTVDAVYLGHVLEHVRWADMVLAVLAEARRVLRSGGAVCVVGPDYDRAVAGGFDQATLDEIRYGAGRWVSDVHLWCATGRWTGEAVRRVFPAAAEVPVGDVDGWPVVSRVGWQCCFVASKEK